MVPAPSGDALEANYNITIIIIYCKVGGEEKRGKELVHVG